MGTKKTTKRKRTRAAGAGRPTFGRVRMEAMLPVRLPEYEMGMVKAAAADGVCGSRSAADLVRAALGYFFENHHEAKRYARKGGG